MDAAQVIRSCPYRTHGSAEAGCCRWDTFVTSFAENWTRWFNAVPTREQWSWALRDWKARNTGYEAAHNAQRRVRAASTQGAHANRAQRALADSLLRVVRRRAQGPRP